MRTASFFGIAALAFLLAARPASAETTQPILTGDSVPTSKGNLIIHPINHATLALGWNRLTVYVDPVGGAAKFESLPRPDLIVITDIHGDHLNVDTLKALVSAKTKIVVPQAVADQLPVEWKGQLTVLTNTQSTTLESIQFEAVAMYNLTPERAKFHSKGRGNGYVLTLGDKRVYLSGDTEDIPEMRALKDIDVAFVCMNLPYTMTVDQAASAVRAFKPKTVYPYHYRGSDVEKFKRLLADEPGITVRLVDWYRP